MVAYNFKQEFADDVAALKKRQTIRANGKRRHARPGEPLQLYTGMRTQGCRKLVLPDPSCKSAEPISIWFLSNGQGINVTVNGKPLEDHALDMLAQADGFRDADGLRQFIAEEHGLPFDGTLIKW
jgi:hypothetical protein